MITLSTEFWVVMFDDIGTDAYLSVGCAYDAWKYEASASTQSRVFHTTLDVETNAHETTREVTDDFITRMIEEAHDLDDLPTWIQDDYSSQIAEQRVLNRDEAAHVASFSTPSI